MICLTVSVTSCRSVNEIVKEIPVHDTTYITKTQRDSAYIDRWHTEYVKGDTVFVTNNQITVKYRTISDTAYKYVEKPVEVVVNQIKEIDRPLRWWQKTMMWCGVCFILVLIGFGISLYVKLKG